MPARFAATGDRHAKIDEHPGSLEPLLELSATQEAEGLGDAPWPPHYAKQPGEPPRVAPSRKKNERIPRGRRVSTKPLVEIGRADKKEDALAESSAGRRATPRPPGTSSPLTCSSIRCGAAPRPGPASA